MPSAGIAGGPVTTGNPPSGGNPIVNLPIISAKVLLRYLIPHECDDHALVRIFSGFSKPFQSLFKTRSFGHIVHKETSRATPVIAPHNAAETVLSCCVPALQFHVTSLATRARLTSSAPCRRFRKMNPKTRKKPNEDF